MRANKSVQKEAVVIEAARREASAARALNRLINEYGKQQNALKADHSLRDVSKVLRKETQLLQAAVALYEARRKTRKS